MLARFESRLGRIELLELLRRLARCSLGSDGCSPENLANTLRTSVSEMTALSFPEMRVPAMADAGTAVAGAAWGGTGEVGTVDGLGNGPLLADGALPRKLCGPMSGVAGAEGDGDDDSTTHMRWDLVATSLATVCASVEYGLT